MRYLAQEPFLRAASERSEQLAMLRTRTVLKARRETTAKVCCVCLWKVSHGGHAGKQPAEMGGQKWWRVTDCTEGNTRAVKRLTCRLEIGARGKMLGTGTSTPGWRDTEGETCSTWGVHRSEITVCRGPRREARWELGKPALQYNVSQQAAALEVGRVRECRGNMFCDGAEKRWLAVQET